MKILRILLASIGFLVLILIFFFPTKPDLKLGDVAVVTSGVFENSKIIVVDFNPATKNITGKLIEYRGQNHDFVNMFKFMGAPVTVNINDLERVGTFREYFLKMVKDQMQNRTPPKTTGL